MLGSDVICTVSNNDNPRTYSILPNRRVYTFISGQVCLLGSIKVKRQTWPEINVYTRLFGSIE